MKLTIGTCQFPVSKDIKSNTRYVLRQMKQARKSGAEVVSFSEAALSGYAGCEFPTFEGYDWPLLERCTQQVMDLAKELKMWVVLGSSHRLTDKLKAHNSHYIINDRGRIIDRYDKMFCAGNRSEKTGDFVNYRPGDHFCIFSIKGIKCGVQICHDFRYQETYREHYRRGVKLMFQAFQMGGRKKSQIDNNDRKWEDIVPATLQTYAANNGMRISVTNTCRKYSSLPSFFVELGGVITGRLRNHVTGVLISTMDTDTYLPDPSRPWRQRAMRGIYHSGTLKKDKRTECRTAY